MVKTFTNGLFKENPVFVLVLGLCPTLAVTTGVKNALGMGMATTFVLLGSNIIVSLIRKLIPKEIRIPCFIVVIATFVTIIQMTMEAFLPALNKSLGLFIPLIVVNCIILGRAEAFASKNSIAKSTCDALGMGLGFTLALTLIGLIREIAGTGRIFDIPIAEGYQPAYIFIMAPGAFIIMGLLIALFNALKTRRS